VILSGCGTLFSILDLPVYAPILSAYLGALCLFVLIRTIKHRKEANAIPSNDTPTTTMAGTVRISLKLCTIKDIYAITTVTPWSALRGPPSNLRLSQSIWRDFLEDLEGAMIDDKSERSLLFSSIGKLFAVLYLCGYVLFDVVYQSPFLSCDPNAGCNRFLWTAIVTQIPVFVYAFLVVRSVQKFQAQRVADCLEAVEQVCAALRAENAQIVVKVTTSNWKTPPLVVEVGAAPTAPAATTAMVSSQKTGPNDKTKATDPLLVDVV
jgi:hypothetical protein